MVDELDGTLKGQRVFDRLSRLRQPSIAYVNGYALGGGCELSLACTFRVAAPRARLGLSEVKLGLVPGYGGTQRLIGTGRALDLMLSDDMLGAEDALAMSLTNRMIPEDEGLDSALAYAARFSDKRPVAISLIRESVRQGMDLPLDNGLAIEAQNSVLSYRTADGQEGLNACLTKRSPQFKDERHGHATRRRKE
ncbi:hypothetical protein GCM10011319_18950 [Mameliella alba]|nr:hypothetical protein GCM10011319_18950 [Mameliella alba]